MAETEQKDQITYTPEELEEINRIVEVVNNSQYSRPLGVPAAVAEPVSEPEIDAGEEFPEINIGEPDDLDLPLGDLDGFGDVEEIEPVPEPLEGIAAAEDLPLEDLMSVAEEVAEESAEEFPDISMPGEDFSEIQAEDLTELGESEVEDISDLIEEVEDIGEPGPPGEIEDLEEIEELDEIEEIEGLEELPGDVSAPEEIETLDDLTGDLTEETGEAAPDFEEMDFAADISGEEAAEAPPGEPLSALDELDALTSEEPESLDDQELADTEFVGGDEFEPVEEVPEEIEELEDAGVPEIDLDDLAAPSETVEAPDDTGVAFEQGIESDIPDLSDISFEEGEDIPEAAESDIPDIGFDDIGGEDISEETSLADEIDGIPDLGDLTTESEETPGIEEIEDIDIEPIDDVAEPVPVEQEDISDDFAIEPLEEEEVSPADTEGTGGGEPLELSERELKKLKKAIILLHPNLRTMIKNIIVNDRLAPGEARQLVDMVMESRPEHEIAGFIEEQLGMAVDLSDETASEGRRIIHARPEYTREGRERQKKLLKLTRIFGGVAAAACVVTLLSYQYIYKPIMAKKKIHEGVQLILAPGDYLKKPKDYIKAEDLVKEVEENYKKDFVYGFNAYGDAYFRQKEYLRSYQKYNKSYSLEPGNIETLNNLGRFYSRVPKEFYNSVKGETEKLYFEKEKGNP